MRLTKLVGSHRVRSIHGNEMEVVRIECPPKNAWSILKKTDSPYDFAVKYISTQELAIVCRTVSKGICGTAACRSSEQEQV